MATPAIPSPSPPRRIQPVLRRAPRQNADLQIILPAVLLFYAALMPSEIRVELAGQNLYAPRIAGLLMLPFIISRLASKAVKLLFWDFLFLFSAFWMILAFIVYYGPSEGALRGGALAFDVAVPYIVGRTCIRDANDFRRFLIFVAPGLALAAASMMLEVLAARPLVRPLMAQIFGNLQAYEGGVAVGSAEVFIDRRLGILRASGPFSHPILAGLVLASFMPLFWFSGIRKWPWFAGFSASVLAVLSASSAAFLSLLISAALLGMDWLQRLVTFLSWKIFIPTISVILGLIHFLSDSGLVNVVIRYSLNPVTARYRRLIWEFGVKSIEQNPWFGIGFTSYQRLDWMIASVDNHWLLLGIRFGMIPAFGHVIVLIAAIVMLCLAASRANELDRRLNAAIAISLLAILLMGFTVAFFGGAAFWFYMLIGIGFSVAAGTAAQQPRGIPGVPMSQSPTMGRTVRAPGRRMVRPLPRAPRRG